MLAVPATASRIPGIGPAQMVGQRDAGHRHHAQVKRHQLEHEDLRQQKGKDQRENRPHHDLASRRAQTVVLAQGLFLQIKDVYARFARWRDRTASCGTSVHTAEMKIPARKYGWKSMPRSAEPARRKESARGGNFQDRPHYNTAAAAVQGLFLKLRHTGKKPRNPLEAARKLC